MNHTQSSTDIVVNGEPYDGGATTLSELLQELGYGDQKVATAVNGDFVPGRDRDTFEIRKGDHVEVVAPRQGG